MNVLEAAMKMETDAISFYTEVAHRVQHPVAKKMFLTIVEDEKRHREMIAGVVQGLAITHKDVSPLNSVMNAFESMKDEMLQQAAATKDELEAFQMAMTMETEGKVFYEKLLSEVKSEKEKQLLKRLILEEQEHYAVFSNTYQYLADTGNWFMWKERRIVEGG
jgi:rubrerythrin